MRKIILALSLVFPLSSQASTAFNMPEVACSGDLISLGQSLTCGGDLSISDGDIYSDHAVAIEASGNIFIANLNIRVFSLLLRGWNITFGEGVRIDARYITAIGLEGAQENIDLSPGVVITVGGYNPGYLGGSYESVGISPGGNIVVGGGQPVFGGDGAIPLPVPEPTTYSLMLAGLVGLGLIGRRKKRV